MERVILHIDMNNFFASVECALNPAIADEPVVVCGDAEQRHGIVLAKNALAKRAGIKTGETLGDARRKCAGLICVPANYENYVRVSRQARELYESYTPLVEAFGLDEAWLDISSRGVTIEDGRKIADELRRRIKAEIGVTASVGVSFCKIFAKLGSDYKKPDATTVISKENMRDIVWPLPVRDLLYVGKATEQKLTRRNINTIGGIAKAEREFLRGFLGKWGEMLWSSANGLDAEAVSPADFQREVKSIGNSTTTYRDLMDMRDVKNVMYMLCAHIAEKLRKKGLMTKCVKIGVRYADLSRFEQQRALPRPTDLEAEISKAALSLVEANNCCRRPIRSIGVTAQSLVSAREFQTDIFFDERQARVEKTIAALKEFCGKKAPVRAATLFDKRLCDFDENRRQVFKSVELKRGEDKAAAVHAE